MWFINSLLLIHFAWPVFEYLKPLVLMVTCLERRLQGPYHIKVSTVSSSDRATWQIWYTCVTNFFLSVQHHHLMCTNILYILCIQLLILKKRRKRLREIQKGGGGEGFFPQAILQMYLGATVIELCCWRILMPSYQINQEVKKFISMVVSDLICEETI